MLPLHQRLQLLKLRHGCSASEAQRLVWAGAKGTGDPWSDADPRESGGLRDADGQQPASVEVGGGGSTADSSLSEAAEDVATGHSAGGTLPECSYIFSLLIAETTHPSACTALLD